MALKGGRTEGRDPACGGRSRETALERKKKKQVNKRKEDRRPFPGGSNIILPPNDPPPLQPIQLIPCKMLALRPKRERHDNGGFIRLE